MGEIVIEAPYFLLRPGTAKIVLPLGSILGAGVEVRQLDSDLFDPSTELTKRGCFPTELLQGMRIIEIEDVCHIKEWSSLSTDQATRA